MGTDWKLTFDEPEGTDDGICWFIATVVVLTTVGLDVGEDVLLLLLLLLGNGCCCGFDWKCWADESALIPPTCIVVGEEKTTAAGAAKGSADFIVTGCKALDRTCSGEGDDDEEDEAVSVGGGGPDVTAEWLIVLAVIVVGGRPVLGIV